MAAPVYARADLVTSMTKIKKRCCRRGSTFVYLTDIASELAENSTNAGYRLNALTGNGFLNGLPPQLTFRPEVEELSSWLPGGKTLPSSGHTSADIVTYVTNKKTVPLIEGYLRKAGCRSYFLINPDVLQVWARLFDRPVSLMMSLNNSLADGLIKEPQAGQVPLLDPQEKVFLICKDVNRVRILTQTELDNTRILVARYVAGNDLNAAQTAAAGAEQNQGFMGAALAWFFDPAEIQAEQAALGAFDDAI